MKDRVLALRGIGKSHEDISALIGVSSSTIRQIVLEANRDGYKPPEPKVEWGVFEDDPRASRPDYGTLPMPTDTKVWRATGSSVMLLECLVTGII